MKIQSLWKKNIKNVAKKVVGEDAKPIDELSAELLHRAAKKSASYYQPQGDPVAAPQRRQTKRLKIAAAERDQGRTGDKQTDSEKETENSRNTDIKKYGAGTEFSPSKDEGVGVDLGSDGLSSGKLGGLRTN